MCFLAVVFWLTSWISRGMGEPWLLALGCGWGMQELTWRVPPQESWLPAYRALNLVNLSWSHGCPIVRHFSINPCVFPCKELGSSQKFITDEIFQIKLLECTLLVFPAELFYRTHLVVVILVSLSALTILQWRSPESFLISSLCFQRKSCLC